MADGKKSFVMYCDQIHSFEALSDDEAGRLIKHIFRYVNDQNPQTEDRIVEISFAPIKQQLKRDLKDWENTIKAKSDGGKKSAAVRKQLKEIEQELSILKKVKDTSKIVEKTASNSTVNVNDNVNVNVNDSNTHTLNKNFFRPNSDYFIELSEMDIGKAIEYISRTKNVSADKKMILAIFDVFKIKNLTGEKVYRNDKDIIRHFFESLKFEKPNETHKQSIPGSSKKLGTSAARIEAARNF